MTADTDAPRLVPAEPTPEMIEAGYEPWLNKNGGAGRFIVRNVFKAMIAAAPAVQPAAGRVKPLDWHKPTKRELEEGGRDCALWIAPGFGGEYAIQADGANFILWRVDDPYAFDTFQTVEAAKAHAEADWQNTIGRKLAAISTPAQASGEPVAWRYRWKPTPRSQPGEWREPTNIRWGEEDRTLYEEQPLYAHPPKPDARLSERLDRLTQGAARQNEEICQALGKALGYPWFKDDQKNFPGATEADGVCVGDHVAESLADEAARRIREIDARLSVAMEALKGIKAASAYSIAAIALRQIGSTEKGEWQ